MICGTLSDTFPATVRSAPNPSRFDSSRMPIGYWNTPRAATWFLSITSRISARLFLGHIGSFIAWIKSGGVSRFRGCGTQHEVLPKSQWPDHALQRTGGRVTARASRRLRPRMGPWLSLGSLGVATRYVKTIRLITAFFGICFASCAHRGTVSYRGGDGRFASLHPATARFDNMLARRASEPEVERAIAELYGEPVHVWSRSQLVRATPPRCYPSARAFALLHQWHDGTYAQLIDDVRVLACFDVEHHLAAYELF